MQFVSAAKSKLATRTWQILFLKSLLKKGKITFSMPIDHQKFLVGVDVNGKIHVKSASDQGVLPCSNFSLFSFPFYSPPPGLSLKVGGWGIPLATTRLRPGYFK